MSLTWRYARAGDIRVFFPAEQRVPTMRAVTVLRDGEPAALIGVARRESFFAFFSESRLTPEETRRIPVLRALKVVEKIIASTPRPVIADSGNRALMLRMGFTPLNDEGLYLWT